MAPLLARDALAEPAPFGRPRGRPLAVRLGVVGAGAMAGDLCRRSYRKRRVQGGWGTNKGKGGSERWSLGAGSLGAGGDWFQALVVNAKIRDAGRDLVPAGQRELRFDGWRWGMLSDVSSLGRRDVLKTRGVVRCWPISTPMPECGTWRSLHFDVLCNHSRTMQVQACDRDAVARMQEPPHPNSGAPGTDAGWSDVSWM